MNLKRLILAGEHVTMDFKKTISSAEKIAKTLVAFANNKGGQLLVGVTDQGVIKGVKSEEEEKYMITKAAHRFCKPALEPKFEEIYVDDKVVLLVTIAASEHKPHYALDDQKKWWAYVRIADKSVLASKIMVDVLKETESNTGQLIAINEPEKKLLTYLDKNGRITLKEFVKLTRWSNKKAQRTIVKLILAGILLPHSSEKEEYFTALAL